MKFWNLSNLYIAYNNQFGRYYKAEKIAVGSFLEKFSTENFIKNYFPEWFSAEISIKNSFSKCFSAEIFIKNHSSEQFSAEILSKIVFQNGSVLRYYQKSFFRMVQC